MKVSELEKVILDNASKLNLNRGKEILKSGDLTKVNINKIKDNYNIYGNFRCENKLQSCNSHLKIDIRNKRITYAKCECSVFLEVDSKNNIYLCEHLVAIGLGFVREIKKKLNKPIENNEVLRKDKNILQKLADINNTSSNEETNCDLRGGKEKLELNIYLKEVFEDQGDSFDISIFIGINTMYLISNIQEFIMNLNKSKEYYIGKGLIYNIHKYYFSKEDKEMVLV